MAEIAQVAIRGEQHRRSTPALPQRRLPGWQTEELPGSMVGVHNCENITFLVFVQPRMATIHCAESSRRVANGHSQQDKSALANGVGLVMRAQLVTHAVVVCVDKGNREVFRLEACVRPFLVTRSFVSVAEGAYCARPAFQRFLQQKTERAKARGQAMDLWR